MGDFIDYK